MRFAVALLTFLLAPPLLLGCDSADADPTGIGNLTLTLNPVPFEPENVLLIQTEDEYSEMCALGADVDVRGESVTVEITGGMPTGACLTAVGPWSRTVRLPDEGIENYEVILSKDGETDRYRISRPGDELPLVLSGSGTFSRVVPAEFPKD